MIVRMGSLSGAEALGLASELGSVEIGKSAKLAIVRLPSGSQPTLAAILGDPTSTVQPLLQ
jgi:imidazolonepropionase-like amidohydrolase